MAKRTNEELFSELGAATSPQERTRIRNEIVTNNLALVRYRARNNDDHFQAGVIGLMQAVDAFEPERGFTFATYASPKIIAAIMRERKNRKLGELRLPMHVQDLRRSVLQAGDYLTGKQGSPASIEDVAKFLEMSVERLRAKDGVSSTFASLDAPLSESSVTPLGNMIADTTTASPEEVADENDRRAFLESATNELSEQHGTVFRMLREGATLDVVGVRVGLSRERVRQIYGQTIARLSRLQVGATMMPTREERHNLVVELLRDNPTRSAASIVVAMRSRFGYGDYGEVRRFMKELERGGYKMVADHEGQAATDEPAGSPVPAYDGRISKAGERLAYAQEIGRQRPDLGIDEVNVLVRERFGMGINRNRMFSALRKVRPVRPSERVKRPAPALLEPKSPPLLSAVPAAPVEPIDRCARALFDAMKRLGYTEAHISAAGKLTLTRPSTETIDLAG